MLTKEECVKQLENIRKEITMAYTDICYDKATKISMSEREHSIYLSCNKLERLINEHFDNPPLKFEELKEGMWVWDNITNQYIYIKFKDEIVNGYKRLGYKRVGYNGEFVTNFEENCFYRYEVEDC